ncbi:FAD-binding oxidoreductase [Pseudomonas sp. SST3]|uniref:FAD-binding oxidoreductase n=1 Tax=Pseudomonas sp. SST3 TaxID=2267882 RepID=UPI001F515165|nr:FAD-binding oxidoreductase [Pseudomonas sp. SST3]
MHAAFGADQVLLGEATERYLHDWSGIGAKSALAVLRPRSTEELCALMELCHAHDQPVIPQGGLSGLVGGAVPRGGEVLVSLERMNRIEKIDTESGTVTVEAGAVLQNVQEACREAGALLAIDLGARGSCQIGGNVATNAGGNRVIRYGTTRDLILGLEVVLADGTVLDMMNQMAKNNAGMDLKHLFIGSEGTLGIVSKVVVKLHPLPLRTCTALVGTESYASALTFLRQAQASLSGQVSAFEIMWSDYLEIVSETCALRSPLDGDYPVYVLIDMHCGQPETDAARFQAMLEQAFQQGSILDGAVAQSVAEAASFWSLRDGISEILRDFAPTLNFDVSVPVARIGECAEHIRANLKRDWPVLNALFFGHVGDGNLHVVVCRVPNSPEELERVEKAVYSVVGRYRGSISAEHGVGTLKKHWLAYSRTPAELALMRGLKKVLDPKGLLNPGKLI